MTNTLETLVVLPTICNLGCHHTQIHQTIVLHTSMVSPTLSFKMQVMQLRVQIDGLMIVT